MRRNLEPFRFKEFKVSHKESTLAVGTDAVLLGAWCTILNKEQVLEVGTGCGVISLCLAQRLDHPFYITAIEIDKNSVSEAIENFNNSPWKEFLQAKCSNYIAYSSVEKLDHIISNPPFFRNAFLAGLKHKQQAKHQDVSFQMNDFAKYCYLSLKEDGKVSLVYPWEDIDFLLENFILTGFAVSRLCKVYSKSSKPISRVLIEFSKIEKEKEETQLIIYNDDNTYTEEYKSLTASYYLNF